MLLSRSKTDLFPSAPPSEYRLSLIPHKGYSYFELFRYATLTERSLVFTGIFLAILAALGVPLSTVLYAEFTSLLVDRSAGAGASSPATVLQLFGGGRKLVDASHETNMQALMEDALAFAMGSLLLALLLLILFALAVNILNYVALKQIARIRKLFLEAILRKDMYWFDTSVGNNFGSKMTENLDKMKEGIGEKIVIFSFLILTFITGICFSFFYGWELTLVVITCCPFIIISTAMVAKIQASLTEKELKAYAGAGSVAEEVFSSIRTVMAFSGERKESERFAKLLEPAESMGRKKGFYSGLGSGMMWLIIYICFAIGVWYGVKLILDYRHSEDRRYTPAVLVMVLLSIIMGAQNLGYATPHMESFSTAKAAAQEIFSTIDDESLIDPLDTMGAQPTHISGNIEFENLHFHYPARSNVQILNGLSLSIKAGQTVAFVGASGCGKSTCLQLMQRLYDPRTGAVKLDGTDLRQLNVRWLRAQIGVVGQEPVLFATTIGENIRFGKPTATQTEIEAAARMANCHDFISQLPQGYDTMVGERGAQMSGGQKQRIAIARALVRNPKILLLDEATSALDPTSERRVQDALEVACRGRTTLVVSHRLSTIVDADKIVFVKDGVVVEEGTHEELMQMEGLYYQLINVSKRKEETDDYKAIKDVQLSDTSLVEQPDKGNKDDGSSYFDDIECQRMADKKKSQHISFWQLLKLNSAEWKLILVGCIASIVLGSSLPVWAIYFGNFFGALSNASDEQVHSETDFIAWMFIAIGVVSGLATWAQAYMFTLAGTKMTSRLRQTAFETIIRKEVAFFDHPNNSTGALCSRLAGDCSSVQGATGTRIGLILQGITTVGVGFLVSLYYSWNLTLVTSITIPFVCMSILLEAQFGKASAEAEKLAVENASQVAVEAITNIRTVASLGQETYVIQRYCRQIDGVDEACRNKNRYRGLVFGIGQAAPQVAYAISLYYGAFLVVNEGLAYDVIIKISEALIFGSWILGQALSYAPNINAAILSAGRLLKLFETPVVQTGTNKDSAEQAEGDITYEHVDFHYPNRETQHILEDLNLTIARGKTVALVGPSGSGKSTCVQLLLRYYDPVSGHVNLNGIPTTEFSYDTLRSHMGLVSQEPVLFDRTIAENIAYGDNFRDEIPMAEIIAAAKKSNIHSFITLLPKGYDTSLGSKGAQLSGGQKQRIAIARALVRNPKILILDEATSALDLESEKVVQEALDVARKGRTCLTIAHRLTTVRDADLIYVLKKGIVVEQGNHDELMKLDGVYANLYWLQQVA